MALQGDRIQIDRMKAQLTCMKVAPDANLKCQQANNIGKIVGICSSYEIKVGRYCSHRDPEISNHTHTPIKC